MTHAISQTKRLTAHCNDGLLLKPDTASTVQVIYTEHKDASYAYRAAVESLQALVPNINDLHFRDTVALEVGMT